MIGTCEIVMRTTVQETKLEPQGMIRQYRYKSRGSSISLLLIQISPIPVRFQFLSLAHRLQMADTTISC